MSLYCYSYFIILQHPYCYKLINVQALIILIVHDCTLEYFVAIVYTITIYMIYAMSNYYFRSTRNDINIIKYTLQDLFSN